MKILLKKSLLTSLCQREEQPPLSPFDKGECPSLAKTGEGRFTEGNCPLTYELLSKKGFTLVEVLISLVVLLLVSLALMQTALVSIDSNMINVLRDEAVSIAEERMNEARNTAFDSLTVGPTFLGTGTPPTVKRNLRNITAFPYTVKREIAKLGTDNKQITITITWEWKEKTVANDNPYTHSITSIVRRQ